MRRSLLCILGLTLSFSLWSAISFATECQGSLWALGDGGSGAWIYPGVLLHTPRLFIAHGMSRSTKRNPGILNLFQKKDMAYLGQISLVRHFYRKAESGIEIEPSVRGQGVASESLYALTDYAFQNLGLRQISARIYDDNFASQSLYERTGFRFSHSSDPSMFESVWSLTKADFDKVKARHESSESPFTHRVRLEEQNELSAAGWAELRNSLLNLRLEMMNQIGSEPRIRELEWLFRLAPTRALMAVNDYATDNYPRYEMLKNDYESANEPRVKSTEQRLDLRKKSLGLREHGKPMANLMVLSDLDHRNAAVSRALEAQDTARLLRALDQLEQRGEKVPGASEALNYQIERIRFEILKALRRDFEGR